MGVNYSPKIVTDGLWGCWDFANKKSFDGSSVSNFRELVYNKKQFQNNIVVTGQWDPRGYYTIHSPAYGDGTAGYHNGNNVGWKFAHDQRSLSTEGTFEAVVETYHTNISQDMGIWGQAGFWRLMQEKQKWEFWARENGSGSSGSLKTGDIITKNEWTHFVGTIKTNPGLMKIYINGEEVASQTTPWAWGEGAGTDHMNIGQSWWGDSDSYFRGAIRLCRAYTKQLSQKQVKQNYDTVKDWMVYATSEKTVW